MQEPATVRRSPQLRERKLKSTNARRLEMLWSGPFGQAYTRRNDVQRPDLGALHHALCQRLGVRSVLEVGCNVGLNFMRIAVDETIEVAGVDVNAEALATARQRMPRGTFLQASAYALPFASESFDLVFTCGVLIHVPLDDLPAALREIHRTSRRYIWSGEYYSAARAKVPYQGQTHALFKDDFGRRYRELFPELALVETGFLGHAESGFDDLTWWLFEKGPAGAQRRGAPTLADD